MLSTVKKIVCRLLIVWLSLVSSGVSAHAMNDEAHDASHAVYVVEQNSPLYISALDANMSTEVNHCDACIHTNCCFVSALVVRLVTHIAPDLQAVVPAFQRRWFSHLIFSNIDRPKWLHTTPAVVSLLS